MVVASSAITYGDKVDAGHLTVAQLPAERRAGGRLLDRRPGARHARRRAGGADPDRRARAAAAVQAVGPGAAADRRAEIGEGMRAYTIKVTDVTGVGGHALPGDRVDVVLMRDLTSRPNGRPGQPSSPRW